MLTLIFDTETTGLPKNWKCAICDVDNWPRMVQLSFIVSDGSNSQEFNYIVKPAGYEIPEEVANIHGITTDRAIKEGIDLEFVLSIFMAMLNIADKVVAHNIEFDKAIIGAEFYRIEQGAQFEEILQSKELFCTMKESTNMVGIHGSHGGGFKWPKLIELHRHLFNEDFEGAHDALFDTRACARCYFALTSIDKN